MSELLAFARKTFSLPQDILLTPHPVLGMEPEPPACRAKAHPSNCICSTLLIFKSYLTIFFVFKFLSRVEVVIHKLQLTHLLRVTRISSHRHRSEVAPCLELVRLVPGVGRNLHIDWVADHWKEQIQSQRMAALLACARVCVWAGHLGEKAEVHSNQPWTLSLREGRHLHCCEVSTLLSSTLILQRKGWSPWPPRGEHDQILSLVQNLSQNQTQVGLSVYQDFKKWTSTNKYGAFS